MQKPKQLANSAKKWLAHMARFLVLLVPTLALSAPSYAAEEGGVNWGRDIGNLLLNIAGGYAIQDMLRIVNLIVGGLLTLIYSIAQKIVTGSIIGGQRVLLESSAISNAWDITLSATNALLALALAVMAVLIITGLQNYNIKKAVTSLIYAIAVANLSYEIILLLVDIGDALQKGIVAAFGSFGATANPALEWLDSMSTMFNPYSTTFWERLTMSTSDVLLQTIVSIVTLAIGAYVMVKLGFVLIERAVRLALAIVLAPLLFVAQLFPGIGMDKLASNWWSDAIKWVLVYPGVYLLLSLAGLITKDHTLNLGNAVTQIIDGGDSVIADLMLAIAAITLTLAASNIPGLLGLKATSDKFFSPISKAISGAGSFAFNLAKGAMFKKGAEARDFAAEGKFASWVPDLAGGKFKKGLTGIARFAKGVETTVAQVQRTAKDVKEFPGKRNEKLLGEFDHKQTIALRAELIQKSANLADRDELTQKSASMAGISVQDFEKLPLPDQESFNKSVLATDKALADRLGDAIKSVKNFDNLPPPDQDNLMQRVKLQDHLLAQKLKDYGKNYRDSIIKKAKENVEDGITPEVAISRLDRDTAKYFAEKAKANPDKTDLFKLEKLVVEGQETMAQLAREPGHTGYEAQRLFNGYLAKPENRVLPNYLLGHRSFLPATPPPGVVDPETLLRYEQLPIDTAIAKTVFDFTVDEASSAATTVQKDAINKLVSSLEAASPEAIEAMALDLTEKAFPAMRSYIAQKTDKAKQKALQRITGKQAGGARAEMIEKIGHTHRTLGITTDNNKAEKKATIHDILTSKLSPITPEEIEYVDTVSEILTEGNLNLSDLNSAEAVYGNREQALTQGVDPLAIQKIATHAHGYVIAREETEKIGGAISKTFGKSENLRAIGQKITEDLQATGAAWTFDTRKAAADRILSRAIINGDSVASDMHGKSAIDIVKASGASADDADLVEQHIRDFLKKDEIWRTVVPDALDLNDAVNRIDVHEFNKLNRKSD